MAHRASDLKRHNASQHEGTGVYIILQNIKGVKDATGDLRRVGAQLKAMGKEFIQLTGNDDNALEFNKKGGVGSISVTANIAAKLCSDFQNSCVNGFKDSVSILKNKGLIFETKPTGTEIYDERPAANIDLTRLERGIFYELQAEKGFTFKN